MSLIRKLSTLPEVVRRHLAGEDQATEVAPIQVHRIDVRIPEPRIAQFGYGDPPDLEDDDAEPGVH